MFQSSPPIISHRLRPAFQPSGPVMACDVATPQEINFQIEMKYNSASDRLNSGQTQSIISGAK